MGQNNLKHSNSIKKKPDLIQRPGHQKQRNVFYLKRTRFNHTPITREIDGSVIDFSNMIRRALGELEKQGLNKRRLADLQELLNDVLKDEVYWRYQANSLAVFATPDEIRTFRLANHIESQLEVSDRFNIKPLLRATTFDNSAYVIALSEHGVRLVQIFSDIHPEEIEIPDRPKALPIELKLEDSAAATQHKGDEVNKLHLAKYCRRVDAALAPLLHHSSIPVIVMAARPTSSVFHNLCSANHLLPQIISQSPDRMSLSEIADEARKVLDVHYKEVVAQSREQYEVRSRNRRASSSLEEVARAATLGSVETLYINIDSRLAGTLDAQNGTVDYAPADAVAYNLASEITRRALAHGSKMIALRTDDMPAHADVAATMRYAIQ